MWHGRAKGGPLNAEGREGSPLIMRLNFTSQIDILLRWTLVSAVQRPGYFGPEFYMITSEYPLEVYLRGHEEVTKTCTELHPYVYHTVTIPESDRRYHVTGLQLGVNTLQRLKGPLTWTNKTTIPDQPSIMQRMLLSRFTRRSNLRPEQAVSHGCMYMTSCRQYASAIGSL